MSTLLLNSYLINWFIKREWGKLITWIMDNPWTAERSATCLLIFRIQQLTTKQPLWQWHNLLWLNFVPINIYEIYDFWKKKICNYASSVRNNVRFTHGWKKRALNFFWLVTWILGYNMGFHNSVYNNDFPRKFLYEMDFSSKNDMYNYSTLIDEFH